MWRKGRHYSLKNSLLIQKTDSGHKRNFHHPRHKALGKGAGKVGAGRRKVAEKAT